MRWCIFGNTGDGKTISAVNLLDFYHSIGFKIFANIDLMEDLSDYEKISNTGFTDKVNKYSKNIVLIDEVGKTLYESNTTNAIKLSDLVTQSRKSVGEESHMVFTTQTESQINEILANLSDWLIYSRVMFRYNDFFPNLENRNEGKIPIMISHHVRYKVYDQYNQSYFIDAEKPIYYLDRKITDILTDLSYSNYVPVDFKRLAYQYDTYEEVERFGDGSFIKYKNIYKDYVGKDGILNELKTKLIFEQHLNPTEAGRIARAIKLDLEG